MTIQEAREIYLKSDCSHFIMCTNYYSSYIQYKRQEISKEQEIIWKKEKVRMLSLEIRKTGDYRIFNRLYDITEEFHNYEYLQLLFDTLKRIRKPITADQSVCVAETILGRKAAKNRSGLIYWAYDIGQKAIAIVLMDQVLEFLHHPDLSDEKLEKLIRRLRRLCKNIILELELNFSGKYLKHYYNF